MEEYGTNTKLAFNRTSLAYDRTLMAWIRTATSLISFGFTIYKFFQLEINGKKLQGQVIGPRQFAMLMIVIGLLALAAATVQYIGDRKRLRTEYKEIPGSVAGIVSALISIMGIVALAAVIFRL